MRVGITLIFFFFFFSKRLVVMATQQRLLSVHLPSLTVCMHVQNKRRWEKKQTIEEDENQKNVIAAGSQLSVCRDGFLQNVRALKIKTSTHTHTHTHIEVLSYVLCVLKFHPDALPQIPLHPVPAPPFPPKKNIQRIQSAQLRQLVWKRISKAPNFSFNDSLPSTAVF